MTNPFTNQMQQFQFLDKYSRFDHELGRRETWEESVERSVQYLMELSENKLDSQDYNDIRQAMLNMEAFPSMRLFAMAGDAARRDNSVLFNCSFVGVDSILSISEALYLSMSGVGVGYSVENRYISKLPVIGSFESKYHSLANTTMIIDDTQAGWAKAFEIGLSIWMSGSDMEFDYSLIREAGTVLKTKGGRASGYGVLRDLLDFTRKTIMNCSSRNLTSIEVHDIMTSIGDCARSGGNRRSAMISLFDATDEAMLHSKDNGWWKDTPQRANANNSIVIENELSREEVASIMQTMHSGGGGEPGMFLRQNTTKFAPRRDKNHTFGTNPCQPDFAKVLTRDGEKRIAEIEIGDEIYSQDGWVEVMRILNQGVKSVYSYGVDGYGVFVGTRNHKILTREGDRVAIDTCFREDIDIPLLNENNGSIVYAKVDECAFVGDYEVYSLTVDGDNHTYWTSGMSVCNCGEIGLRSKSFCNLSQAIARTDDTYKSLAKKVRIATIIGTIQSSATNFEYISDKWRENTEDERLLGVDITSQMDAHHLFDSDVFSNLRGVAIDTNREYAKKLGINQSVAITCNKPSGNSSVLFNCSAGLHSRWSDYYIRRVRINAHSPMLELFKFHQVPLSPENGQTVDNATAFVAEFPMKAPDGSITNGSRSAIAQLEWWKLNKVYWTEHNPSCTISYKKEELASMIDWLYKEQHIIGGLSFLPFDDHYYPLAPYQSISEEIYEEMVNNFPNIDFSLLQHLESEDNTTVAQELACSSGVCEI